MALFKLLRGFFLVNKCFRINLVTKSRFNSLCNPPRDNPQFGARYLRFLRKPSQHDLKVSDDIPEAFELIYRNTMSKYILGAQIISALTGGVVFVGFLFKSEQVSKLQTPSKWSHSARATENEEFYYVSFFIMFIVLIQAVIMRLPMRIYKVPNTPKYIVINYGPTGKQRCKFVRGEMRRMEEKGILPWKENRYLVETNRDRKNFILIETFFRRPADLHIMLGEQRDPDEEEDNLKH